MLLAVYLVMAMSMVPVVVGMPGTTRDLVLGLVVFGLGATLAFVRVQFASRVLVLLTAGLGLRSIISGVVVFTEGTNAVSSSAAPALAAALLVGGAVLWGCAYAMVRFQALRAYFRWESLDPAASGMSSTNK